jgi:tetratricopeptide (TPR) repeat protein
MLIFADSRSVAAVEGAIKIFEQILEFHTLDCICRAEALEDLGNALWQYCYHRAADEARSERCIKLLREALQLRSSDHPLRAHVLHRLATAVRFLGYHCHGNIDALAESITLDRQALKLRHVGHPDRVRSLNNLGVALGISFEYHGDLNMLVEAIAMHRDALRLRPPEHRLRHQSLNNLSGLLLLSFQYQGVPDTLAEAISLSREALQLQSIDRWSALNLLAGSLWVSFSYQGRLDRLDESISLTREALRLLPETHLHRTRVMTGLANVLLARFHAQSDSDALTEAISLLRQVIEMQPLGNPSRDITLAILAGALEANFGEHNRESDLHEALALRRETLQLCSPGHSRRVNRLASLANLYCRPECLSWNEAWTLYHEALRMCSEAHPSRPRLLLGVSRCFLDSNSPFFDLAQGITQLCQGYTGSSSHVTPRLTSAVSALERVEMAYGVISKDLDAPEQLHYMHRILDLHAQIIGLLPDAANLGLDNRDRLEAVTGLDEITRNAAARALQLGRVSQAVEVLEEGRGVFWSQTLRLRSAKFDGVPENDRMELERLLRLLEHGMRKVDGSEQSIAQRDRELESRRRMNQEAETLISKIRDNPGLSRFLLPPAFDALQGALPDGFVVVVNTSKLGHHALVLHRATCFAAVLELERPPQAFNSAVLKAQRPRGSNSIQETEVQDGEVLRAMRLVDAPDGSLEDVLALLWNSIAQPVITKLGLKVR